MEAVDEREAALDVWEGQSRATAEASWRCVRLRRFGRDLLSIVLVFVLAPILVLKLGNGTRPSKTVAAIVSITVVKIARAST